LERDAMQLRLYQRGRLWYARGTVRAGKSRQAVNESTGTSDRGLAEIIAARRETAILDELVHGSTAVVTFGQAARSHLLAGGSRRFLLPLVDRFEHTKLATITQDDLDGAAAALYPACLPSTLVRQCYAPFIAVWNHAVRKQWAEPRKWQRPRTARGTGVVRLAKVRSGTRPIDYDTAARFVGAMSPAPGMVMAFLFFTGMRPIEAFAMTAADVDLAQRWVVLPTSKTGEPRGVPLHSWVVSWLGPLVERGGRVFRTPRGQPYPLTENGGGQMKTAINGARRRSGIAGVSPYTARHSVSTQLVVAGVHPHIKDQILGHAPDDMSRHYTHVPQAPLIAAIDTLPVSDAWRALPWLADPVGWQARLAAGTGARNDLKRRKA